jgi:hypothetical protein
MQHSLLACPSTTSTSTSASSTAAAACRSMAPGSPAALILTRACSCTQEERRFPACGQLRQNKQGHDEGRPIALHTTSSDASCTVHCGQHRLTAAASSAA